MEFFGASKKGAKFERILGSIFEDSGRVRRSRVACYEAFRPLKIAWYGMVGSRPRIQHALAQRAGGLKTLARDRRTLRRIALRMGI